MAYIDLRTNKRGYTEHGRSLTQFFITRVPEKGMKQNRSRRSSSGMIGHDRYRKPLIRGPSSNPSIKDFNDVSFSPLTNNPFTILWGNSISGDNTTNGFLAQLTFNVKTNTPDGKYPLTITYDEDDIYNKDFNNIAFYFKDSSITVNSDTCVYHIVEEWTVIKPANCTEDGLEEGICNVCGLKETRIIPANGHRVTKYSAKEPSCTTDGRITYYYCTECRQRFSDKECTHPISKEDTVIKAIVAVPARAATCCEDGNIAYWHCRSCDKGYSDEARTYEITLESTVIPAEGHKLTRYAAKKPTATKPGRIAYYYCSVCKQRFSDKECTHPITKEDTVIKATGV